MLCHTIVKKRNVINELLTLDNMILLRGKQSFSIIILDTDIQLIVNPLNKGKFWQLI